MELILRKAEEKDLDGLDQVMLVISDKAGDRATVKELLHKISGDPQKLSLIHIYPARLHEGDDVCLPPYQRLLGVHHAQRRGPVLGHLLGDQFHSKPCHQ